MLPQLRKKYTPHASSNLDENFSAKERIKKPLNRKKLVLKFLKLNVWELNQELKNKNKKIKTSILLKFITKQEPNKVSAKPNTKKQLYIQVKSLLYVYSCFFINSSTANSKNDDAHKEKMWKTPYKKIWKQYIYI